MCTQVWEAVAIVKQCFSVESMVIKHEKVYWDELQSAKGVRGCVWSGGGGVVVGFFLASH